MKSFRDLFVWQKSHAFVLAVYHESDKFPKSENFALTNQIRRSVVSITSNIAEGYGRMAMRDKSHFYVIAMGSLRETQNQLIIARDLKYIKEAAADTLISQADEILALIYGLVRRVKARADNTL